MTFSVSRTALQAELQLLTSVVAARGVIPVLSTVMLGCDGEHLTLTTTDLDATLITEIPTSGAPWGGCVPAHTLAGLVKLFSEGEITFTPQKTRLEVKCGPSRHLLPVVPITQFPEIDRASGKAVDVSANLLSRMVKAVSFALLPVMDAINPADFKFTGLSLRTVDGKLEVMGTCKKVTAIAEAPLETAVEPVILPVVAVKALEQFGGETVQVTVGRNHAEFTSGHRTLIARQLMGEFPAWRTFLPEYKYEAQIDRAQFKLGLQRAMLTMGVDNAVGYEPLKLTFTKEQVVVESRGGDRGKSEEPVAITSNLNGEPVALGVVGSQILSVLQGEQVQLSLGPEQPLVFRQVHEGFEFTAIVMPTSLRAWS